MCVCGLSKTAVCVCVYVSFLCADYMLTGSGVKYVQKERPTPVLLVITG